MPFDETAPPEGNIPEEQPIPIEVNDAAEELGSVAVDAGVSSGVSVAEDFHRETPNELYSEQKRAADRVERAEQEAETSQSRYDSHTWVGKHLSGYVKSQGKRAEKAKEDLAAAKDGYDQQLEKAKQYLDKTHEQANEYVSGYQKYADTQQKLAEATGSPVVSVMDINEFIRSSESYGRHYHGSIDETATYSALRDFLTPHSPRSSEFDGRYTKFDEPLPRPDVGVSLDEAMKQVDGEEDAQLLKITDAYIPQVRHGYYTYETVKSPPERSERYVKITPELQELFKTVSPDELNFNTDLHSQKDVSLGTYTPSVAEVGSKFEVISVKDAKEEMEVAQLPHKATLRYEADMGRSEGKAWQAVEIAAESPEQLQERVLTHLLENLHIANIEVDGKRVQLKDFIQKKDKASSEEAA